MDPSIFKGLNNVKYDTRKSAALDLQRLLRQCLTSTLPTDQARITQIIDQSRGLLSTENTSTSRNGGLLALAGAAIALGEEIVPYFGRIIEPVLECFADPDNRIRYFAVECVYNIGKVAREPMLWYFNEIFDGLNRLSTDSDIVVRNGAELLDRLLKDTVCDSVSTYPSHSGSSLPQPASDAASSRSSIRSPPVFLERFVPLLAERIYVISPKTRNHLVSWITVLDSVPELELITYLPSFLDGLLKYLAEDNIDVRVATENVLADFLREIRDIARVQKQIAEERRARVFAASGSQGGGSSGVRRSESKLTMSSSLGRNTDDRDRLVEESEEVAPEDEREEEWEGKGSGIWIPGQGVAVHYEEIVEILLRHVAYPNEIIQETVLHWLSEFIVFAQEVMIPATPALIPAILPNLAHPSAAIQTAAGDTNINLYRLIKSLPAPSPATNTFQSPISASDAHSSHGYPPPPPVIPPMSLAGRHNSFQTAEASDAVRDFGGSGLTSSTSTIKGRGLTPGSSSPAPVTDGLTHSTKASTSTLGSVQPLPVTPNTFSFPSIPSVSVGLASMAEEDPFDYQATVNVLTLQFLSEYEDTRIAALEWLIMLQQKAPKKILAMDDGTFPVLLKCLSDPSSEVIKCDLQLLAQISSSSDNSYFTSFMVNLLELFSTDRRLLETRGSLIIRQLCLDLNAERIYRTLAEILEREEDLEFAASMVQKLNIILITSDELQDFRKRLKNLDSKDGQMLFSIIYRSWCHSPVAVFALCLLAQAYEHASNLLHLFADLDITVQLLVQIDKLVQLIESPVFTALRLQLLEPERYPHLFKCLYGLLMLLPQSTAFVSLRNRLSAVSSMGFLHIPKPTYSSGSAPSARPKLPSVGGSIPGSGDEIKWRELLTHFRAVQTRHEKARRSQQSAASGGGHGSSTLGGTGGAGGGLSSQYHHHPSASSSFEPGGGGSASRQPSVASIPSLSNAPSSGGGGPPSSFRLRKATATRGTISTGSGPNGDVGSPSHYQQSAGPSLAAGGASSPSPLNPRSTTTTGSISRGSISGSSLTAPGGSAGQSTGLGVLTSSGSAAQATQQMSSETAAAIPAAGRASGARKLSSSTVPPSRPQPAGVTQPTTSAATSESGFARR